MAYLKDLENKKEVTVRPLSISEKKRRRVKLILAGYLVLLFAVFFISSIGGYRFLSVFNGAEHESPQSGSGHRGGYYHGVYHHYHK
jgi:hypothetical protein